MPLSPKSASPAVTWALALWMLASGCTGAGGTTDNPADPGTPDDTSQTGPSDGGTDAGGVEADVLPPGWSEASHNKKGAHDYDKIFPSDQVLRIDLTVKAADWQAMQDDMVSMLGAFGQGGGPGGMDGGGPPGGGGPPAELQQACVGKAVGDACSATFNGQAITGTCQDFNGSLICAGGMGGPGGGGPGGNGGGSILPRDPIYEQATVTFGDKQWYHVGLRYKGNSSIATAWNSGVHKLPLHLKFDKYKAQFPTTVDQRFWGFQDLLLSNVEGDNSFIREKLANDLFRAAGVAAPRATFYRVYIDTGSGPVYFGLYLADESPDSAFLKAWFGNSDGNLYKPEGTNANLAGFDEASFEKKSNESAADWSDVKALVTALQADRTDAAGWRTGLEKTVNADRFLRWLATNTLIKNWDSYGQMAHNYYLYGDTKNPTASGQLQWIQWDSSLALQSGGFGGAVTFEMTSVGSTWPLIRYLMDDPQYQSQYYAHLRDVTTNVFTEESLEPKIRAAHALVAPYVTGADGEKAGYTFLSSPAAFDSSVDEILAHVKSQRAAAQQTLARH